MIFIEGKIIDKLVDLAGDDIKYKFSFDLPNGKQHISDFMSWKVFRDWACYIVTDSAWLQIALHYLPNSTVPDDEEYKEFYEDETCYSDEELDELEEKYFW